MSAVAKEGPTGLAKTLLYLAICIQQLPSGFDLSRLQVTSRIDHYESKIISTIQPLVTSDDEIISTLVCLMISTAINLAGEGFKSLLLLKYVFIAI